MSIFNNKYNLKAIDVKETHLVIEMTERSNPDMVPHIVEIPILLFSQESDEDFLLVVDRIEGSQVIIEVSENTILMHLRISRISH